ncbi:MAG: hypothetical protein KC587_02535, partial [Nitrospira sp.]|nr:hypothetical protein [Nitrospira sp.]
MAKSLGHSSGFQTYKKNQAGNLQKIYRPENSLHPAPSEIKDNKKFNVIVNGMYFSYPAKFSKNNSLEFFKIVCEEFTPLGPHYHFQKNYKDYILAIKLSKSSFSPRYPTTPFIF